MTVERAYAGREALTAEALARFMPPQRHRIAWNTGGKRTIAVECCCGWSHCVPKASASAREALKRAERAHLYASRNPSTTNAKEAR